MMLLRYPSPHPHGTQTFVHDALYLRENPTLERGASVISRYSGSLPNFSKLLRRPSITARGSSAGSSPARSPARVNGKSFEGLLQDVTEGIQRRTETWGVAKAVRGAVSDARRNMHTMQWDARRAARSEGAPFSSRNVQWEPESNAADLQSRIEVLEERNKVLAGMLGQALGDLRSHMPKDEGPDTSTTSAAKQALARVESVQICLEDSSIPLESTDMHRNDDDREKTTEVAKDKQPSLPTRSSTSRTKHKSGTTGPDHEAASIPKAPSARPSLADSEFSWMLGGKRHLSTFASSASVPPEQTRRNSKERVNSLFGNGKGKDEDERNSSESDVAMNSLRGKRR